MKGFFAILSTLLMLISAIPITGFAYDEYYDENKVIKDGIYGYVIENDKAILVECDGNASGDIVIPSSFGGAPLTEIYDNTFYSCKGITSVVIPESVTKIGDSAFENCNGIKSVIIPSAVNYIGRWAFAGCSKIESIVIPDGITEITSSCFNSCVNLRNVFLPATLERIGYSAFSDCAYLDNVVIPDSVTYIAEDAFDGTDFYRNPLNYDESGVLYIGKHLIVAPKTIEGDYEIKAGTLTIADYAFMDCAKLKNVIIPESVTTIGWYAFSDCKALQKIAIPASVKEISSGAFDNCTNLSDITLPDVPLLISSSAFSGTAFVADRSNYDEDGVLYIGKHLVDTWGETYPEVSGKYKVKDGTLTIVDSAFYCGNDYVSFDDYYDADKLTEIVFPESLVYIGEYAFCGNTELKKIEIPDSVTYIGVSAFNYCKSVEEIKLSSSLTEISESAFMYCRSLKNITIPEGVTKIGDSAFAGCSSLKEIVIPDSVTEIEYEAFSDSGIEKVVFSKNLKVISEGMFNSCDNLKEIVIPFGVEIIEENAFTRCLNLENVVLPESLKVIDYGAFMYCNKLTSIVIPDSVYFVGERTFSYGMVYEYENGHSTYEERVPYFIIYGVPGSVAEEYAEENELEFVSTKNKNGHIHTYISRVTKSASCGIEGEKILTCSSCNATIREDMTELDHINYIGECILCGYQCDCMCHKAINSKFFAFLWNIVNFFNNLFNINRYCKCSGNSHYMLHY